FHSPLMNPAKEELAAAIASTKFMTPICPVYQNVNALPSADVEVIKKNLMDQLTAPVRWTQLVQTMVKDGGTSFIECGPGKVLQGLVKKIAPQVEVSSL
ncbi:MAG: [acyl-carrier-protein] S-malonyltransferase, partial [Bacteroidota bacterium]